MPIASEIMTTGPLTFDAEISADEAIRQLVDLGYSAAPVVRGEKLLGIVSELELFDVLFDPELRSHCITEFMTESVISVEEDTPLCNVAHLFALHGIRRVPVLREGKPVGVLSRRDLLKYASECEHPLVHPMSELLTSCDEA